MARQRDLNRTRERIMAAAQKEFAASGLAGARTDAIACRARRVVHAAARLHPHRHLVEFEFDYSPRAGFIHAWAFS